MKLFKMQQTEPPPAAVLQELRDRERVVLDELNPIGSEIVQLEQSMLVPGYGVGFDEPKAHHERRAQRNADRQEKARILKERLTSLRRELSELGPKIHEAMARVAESNPGQDHGAVAKAVAEAKATAPSRQAFDRELQILAKLNPRLAVAERELHVIMTTPPPTFTDSAIERAGQFLETGEIPRVTDLPRAVDVAREARGLSDTLREAVKLQTAKVEKLRRQFGRELRQALQPEFRAVAQANTDGIRLAREATLKATMLRQEFDLACGFSEEIPALVFPNLAHPLTDCADNFDMWIERQRRIGLVA